MIQECLSPYYGWVEGWGGSYWRRESISRVIVGCRREFPIWAEGKTVFRGPIGQF